MAPATSLIATAVYMNGEQVASAQDYAASARAGRGDASQPRSADRLLPLGTFTLSENDDTDPSRRAVGRR
jgi:hypothetical protein